MKKLSALAIIFACGLLAACSSVKSPSQKYAKFSAEQLYQTAEIKLAKRSYKDASEAFEALDSLYPFNVNAQQAQLDSIYAYYQDNEMPSAAADAERYIRLYPRSPHVDYAYYMKGLANFSQDRGFFQRYFPIDQSVRDPGTMKQAYQDFLTLLKLYPNSVYAPDAKLHLVYLRDTFARNDLEIAQYYFEKQAYVAAINRANQVLVEYSDTPAAREALQVLEQSYEKLALLNSANQVKQIMAENGVVVKGKK